MPKYLAESAPFPIELTSRRQWLCWALWFDPGDPKLHKLPRNPVTGELVSCDNPATWSNYEDAVSAVKAGRFSGLGIVLTKETNLAILDLENCIDENGVVAEWAQREVEALDSYTEVSASGKGLHVLVWGSVPSGQNKQKLNAELFDSSKMFCLTGIIYEDRSEIKHRDLSSIYKRMQAGTFGPNYKPSPLKVEKYNTQKFRDLCEDNWSAYFDSRSDAIQSVLWTLVAKHDFDKEKVCDEFEKTALCLAWADKGKGPGSKWERLKEKELNRAIEGVRKNIGDEDLAPLAFRKPAAPTSGGYVLLPKDKYDGWFPRGSVSLVAGASGAGKTTLLVDLLVKQRNGAIYLGHVGSKLPVLMLFADRGKRSNNETLERMGLTTESPYIEHLPFCWGADAVANILAKIENRHILPAVVFVEGADLLVEDPNKTPCVAQFLRGLQQIAEHYNIAIICSVGAPKMKGKDGEGYALLRDRVYGSVAWGRTSDTIATLSIPGDGTGSRRSLDVQHRNAASEKFDLEFCNGLLVQSISEAQTLDPFEVWAQSKEEWWTISQAKEELEAAEAGLSRSNLYRLIPAKLKEGKLESKWEEGKRMLRWKKVEEAK